MEKEIANHSSSLAWRIPRTEEPRWGQSMGSQQAGHEWATNSFTFICIQLYKSSLHFHIYLRISFQPAQKIAGILTKILLLHFRIIAFLTVLYYLTYEFTFPILGLLGYILAMIFFCLFVSVSNFEWLDVLWQKYSQELCVDGTIVNCFLIIFSDFLTYIK